MTPTKEESVSPADRNQITITLSDRAFEEYKLLSQWKNQPTATLLREILEQHHLSPSFANAVRRARQDMETMETEE